MNAMANLKIAEGVANGKVQTIVVPYGFKGTPGVVLNLFCQRLHLPSRVSLIEFIKPSGFEQGSLMMGPQAEVGGVGGGHGGSLTIQCQFAQAHQSPEPVVACTACIHDAADTIALDSAKRHFLRCKVPIPNAPLPRANPQRTG